MNIYAVCGTTCERSHVVSLLLHSEKKRGRQLFFLPSVVYIASEVD